MGQAVYVRSPIVKRVSAFDLTTGKEPWNVLSQREVKDHPVVADGAVFFSDSVGYVYQVDAHTGHLVTAHGNVASVPGASEAPTVFRRAAIKRAIGLVSSYRSNLVR